MDFFMGMFAFFTMGLALLGLVGVCFFLLRAILVALRNLSRR